MSRSVAQKRPGVLLALFLSACATHGTQGGERGQGWPDEAHDAGHVPTPVDASPPSARVPNIDAVLAGECATAHAPSRLLPANLLFALDRSSSMACNPPPTTASASCEANPVRADPNEPSKWEITRAELVDAIALLPPQTVVGLAYFSNDDACGVNSMPSVPLAPLGSAQTSTIDASLASVALGGSTPLVGATVLAYQHLHEEFLAARIAGRRFVVLITDGEQSESCSDPDLCEGRDACTRRLVDEEVPKALKVGIGTFVIGAPGSEPARSVLSEIALAGGTAPEGCRPERGECHFDMTRGPDFGRGLRNALADIAGRVIRCEFPVPGFDGADVDLDLVNIVYTPGEGERRVIVRDDRAPCDVGADGWQYASDGSEIRLCGKSCEDVRGDPDAQLDIVLGCAVIVPT